MIISRTVRLIYSLYLSGLSNATIASELTTRLINGPNGMSWYASTIGKMLQDTRYIGHDSKESGWPPIIEPEQFDAVQLEKQKRAKRNNHHKNEH